MSKILSAFVAMLIAFFVSTPAFAQSPQWEAMAGDFKCGSADEYVPGATTIAQAAALATTQWDDCERTYGENMCAVTAKGFTVGPKVCDYTRNHDPIDNALGDARAENLFDAFEAMRPNAMLPGNREPNKLFIDTAVKKAYLVIQPKPEATRLPEDPDKRWGFMALPTFQQVNNLCPVEIRGDARSKEYSVYFAECECTEQDVVPGTPGMQIYGEAASRTWLTRSISDAASMSTFKWTQIRLFLEDNPRYSGEVTVDGDPVSGGANPDGGGISVEFIEVGSTMTVKFPNRCERKLQAERLAQAEADARAEAAAQAKAEADHIAEYSYLDFVVAGSTTVGASFFGTGHSIPSAATGSLVAEFGLEGSSPNLAFLGTLGIGALFDANCDQPVGMLAQVRLAAVTHRSGPVGLYVGSRIQGAWAVNDTLVVDTPDDPDTEGNEWQGHNERQLGPDAFQGWAEIGPRAAFSPDGVQAGWMLFTLSAGPGLRNVNNDLVLSGQVGVQLVVGSTF